MDALFLKFTEGLTYLDAGLVLVVAILWRDNFALRKSLIELLEKTIEIKTKNIDILSNVEAAINSNTRTIENFKSRSGL